MFCFVFCHVKYHTRATFRKSERRITDSDWNVSSPAGLAVKKRRIDQGDLSRDVLMTIDGHTDGQLPADSCSCFVLLALVHFV